MLQLEQIQWQTDGSALLRLSDSEEVRILALSVTELSLYAGQQLSPDLLEQIQSAGRFREIYKKSLDLLARREHSIWELRQKLRQRFPGFREVEPVLLQLEEQKFLCDERFSLNFVRSRMANRSWGAYRLRAELKQRGVAGQWIDQALASEVDESVLREKAEALVRKFGFPTDPAAKRKLAQKLYQRGFSQELINQVLSQDPL
ncbi:MAG: regulatory protein RecX [Proteobacteria bacterium]|jgi:regulatory protein|nr:MAG: regulatory protein RecX [Pseudomonadota bacterium]|tara:strand:- start:7159 stop:7767 length:609 start_codon:yes stop_codon:yes gene_type:complete